MMTFINILLLIVCCCLSHCMSAMLTETFPLIEQIEQMRKHYDNSKDVLSKFDRVLHLPIQPKKGSTVCIAKGMSHIESKDYALLEKRYKEKSKHVDNSVLWTLAKLPGELQKYIVAIMMEENAIENESDMHATNAFVNTPLLHAMDRYVRVQHLLRVIDSSDQPLVSSLFIGMCPYTARIKEAPRDWLKIGIYCMAGLMSGMIVAVPIPVCLTAGSELLMKCVGLMGGGIVGASSYVSIYVCWNGKKYSGLTYKRLGI